MVESVPLLVAFSAGLLSFLSPCVLPLVPSYVTFVTGLSLDDARGMSRPQVRRSAAVHSLLFIAGFSLVFVALGASATAAGQFFRQHQDLIRRIGGVFVVLLGLHLLGVLRVPFLNVDKRLHLRDRPVGYAGTVLVGVAFAAGWTPCIGPILGTILTLAATTERVGTGVLLLAVYALGLGIPFLLASTATSTFLTVSARFHRFLRPVSIVSGALLVCVGVLIFTNYLAILSGYLNRLLLPILPFIGENI
ncbi:MAG: sulfite exporter TauE/SafE family protein [Gemmatimonadetes bacterium]|nr:sulfite exporter TauE/SafE family protein [Gemmatimonadota bacterium]